jgi:hypothetical protein
VDLYAGPHTQSLVYKCYIVTCCIYHTMLTLHDWCSEFSVFFLFFWLKATQLIS